MDARLLYFGLLGYLATAFLLLGDFLADPGLSFLLTGSVFGLATVLSILGLSRTGRMEMDSAGGIAFLGGVMFIISSALFVLSLVGYYEDLDFCRTLPASIPIGDPRCATLQFSMGEIWLFAAMVAITGTITVGALIRMRRLSMEPLER